MTRLLLIALTITAGHTATAADPAPKPAEFKPKLAHKIEGHTSAVTCVAFSPDGKRLATASSDKTVRIWDVKTGERTARIDNGEEAYCVAFSPDGKKVVVGSDGGAMAIYDAGTGDRESKFGVKYSVALVRWSPDGSLLAVVEVGVKWARLLDPASGKQVKLLEGHTDAINHLLFSPDGKVVATVSRDSTIRLWDPKTGKEKDSFKQHDGNVHGLAFSADGKTLLTGGNDNTVIRWDLKTGNIRKPVMEIPKEKNGGVVVVSELPNGNIWGGTWGDGVFVATPSDGKVVARKPSFDGTIFYGSGFIYNNNKRVLCPDGKHYARVEESTVFVWDASAHFGEAKKED